MILVGTQLLGLPVGDGTGASTTPAPWWAERQPSALRHPQAFSAFEVWPEGALTQASAVVTPRRRGGRIGVMEQAERAVPNADTAGGARMQEVGSMQTNRIAKFLEVNGALSGSRRGHHWFSLPGRWRLPSFQLMRRSDDAGTVEQNWRAGFRGIAGIGERPGR